MKTEATSLLKTQTQNSSERARKVAREFEAMFASMMLKAMRKTVGENSLIPSSMGEKIYTDMLDSEYSKLTADNAFLGLADLIVKEIEGRQPSEAEDLMKGMNIPLWAMERKADGIRESAVKGDLLSRVKAKWSGLIESISARFGVDEHLVTAVIARESAGNPRAVSHKGAKGLMQLMDSTSRDLGVAYPFSPAENISGGVKYLKKMLNMFNGDEKLALASYNAGPGAVKKFNGIPPYRETQEYVSAVLQLREQAAAAASSKSR